MGILDAPDRTQRQRHNAEMELIERLNTEGRPYNSGSFLENVTWTTDGSVSVGFTAPGLTQAWYIDAITLTCNKNARVQLAFYETGLGGPDQYLWQLQTSPNVPLVIPIRQIVRPAVTSFSTGSPGKAMIRNVYDADKTGVNLMAYASGFRIADDLNWGADKVYVHIGDSITGPGTGITNKAKQYDWQLLNYFKDKGHSLRMVNASISGSASTLHESRRAMNAYEWPQADLICYSLGMNDAGQSVPVATFKTNVQNMIAWKKSRYPNAKMLVLGPTPAENDTTENALVAMRSAASDAVTAANDNSVKYLNLGGAFDRKVSSNYATSDAAGSRVHPSDAGHASVFAVIKAFLDANPSFRP